MDPGQVCEDTESVIDGADQGITYTLFCLCHCQPLLEKADASCIPFETAELEEAEKKDGNCQDPKLPTQQQQDAFESAEEAAAAAKKAAALQPANATEDQKKWLDEIEGWATESGMRAGYAETAAENAEMLNKLH